MPFQQAGSWPTSTDSQNRYKVLSAGALVKLRCHQPVNQSDKYMSGRLGVQDLVIGHCPRRAGQWVAHHLTKGGHAAVARLATKKRMVLPTGKTIPTTNWPSRIYRRWAVCAAAVRKRLSVKDSRKATRSAFSPSVRPSGLASSGSRLRGWGTTLSGSL